MKKQDYIDFLEDENEALHMHIAHLEELCSDIINLTFENNAVFDTVLFQKHGCPPIIYKNGVMKPSKDKEWVNVYCKVNEDGNWVSSELMMGEE